MTSLSTDTIRSSDVPPVTLLFLLYCPTPRLVDSMKKKSDSFIRKMIVSCDGVEALEIALANLLYFRKINFK